ncbi:MAG: DUF1993 domain-containing protein [Polyangiaceae bacterium]|nr:DUF1993 domain-containing protein [Polyangiaceae bacterium]
MSLYAASVPQLTKMLKGLSACIDKAVAHATAKGFDPAVFTTARLAPDQYPLTRQVQAACDAAKFAAARLTGKTAPSHPDTETTIPELKARIDSVVEYLAGFSEKDFEGAKDRMISLPFFQGKAITSADYLNEMALPNFYFHVTTAYAILRHNGVDLGKRDFIGSLNLKDA